MKKGILLIALSAVLTVFVNATGVEKSTNPPITTMSINGDISDIDSNETLAGVLVKIEGTSLKTHTDLNGHFHFDGLKAGDYKLNISYISYQDQKVNHTLSTNHENTLKLTIKSE